MQMYRVKFTRKINEAEIDVGDVLIDAQSREMALVGVAEILGLPVTDTQFDIARVKPSFFQISRRIINNKLSTFDADVVNANLASKATFPGQSNGFISREWYTVSATADLRAESENDAIGMLSRAVAREVGGEQQKKSCRNLDIGCDRRALHPRSPAVEENALYEFRRIFQGGDTRT